MKITPEDYNIHNEMEDIVEQALQEVLSENTNTCQCPMCLADMKSIVLNKLPPRYYSLFAKEQHERKVRLDDLDPELFNKILIESYRAVLKVHNHPRHDEGRTQLHNVAEELVLLSLKDILPQVDQSLSRKELSQVMAEVLNDLDARYTTTAKGDAFSRTAEVDPSSVAKIYASIYNALNRISS